MMKIRLEGVAGKRFGYEHNLDVRTPNEAIRALCQLIPGFRAFLSSAHEYGLFFQLLTKDDLIGYDHLDFGASEMTLVPVVTGSFFRSAIGQILLGVVLVAFAFTGFGIITFSAKAASISVGIKTAIMSMGFGMIFTGIAGLFAPGVPDPEMKTEGKPADDAITNAGTGTAGDGTPVPVVYGETLVTNIPVISSYILDGPEEADAKAYWLGVVSEGEIEGFPNSKEEDIFFNGLKGVAAGVDVVEFTDGTQNDVQITEIKNQGFHMQIGTSFPLGGGEYTDNIPLSESPNTVVVRSFNQPYADKIRIRIMQEPFYQTRNFTSKKGDGEFKYLEYARDKDDSGGANNPTKYRIQVFADGSLFHTVEHPTAERILHNKLVVHEVDVSGRAQPISVRIERIDRNQPPEPYNYRGGSGSRSYQWVKGGFTWLSMEVLWNERLVYPHTSLLACSFKAGAVSRIPGITALIKGKKLPVLRRDLSVTYEWSRNPANVVLDLLTNPRYGAGHRTFTTNAPLNQQVFQPGIRFDDIDKASFYKAQKYCEDHDITFDATVAGDADTIELLRSVTSTFQGQLIYQGGYVSVVIDDQVKDTNQHFLFTDANVIQGSEGGEAEPGFIYEGTGKRARTTAIQVSYIDKTNFYKEAKVLVEDRDAMQKYGYNLNKIRALGCTDREQALRMGRYTLATNLRSTETVSFKVGPEGALLLPGDVCLIGDPLKTRIEAGGRVANATKKLVTVDRDLTTGVNYTDGEWYLYTYTTGGLAERSKVKSITGRTITVSGFSQAPSSNMLWILVDEGPTNNTAHRFNRYKVQKITENNDGTYSIIGIKYDHAKYDFVNKGEADYGQRKTLNTKVNKGLDASKIDFKIRTTNPMP
tara:strand:+ start:3802 stop:6411 length:2610 start_codon:yes stop_codon:yes gene_type:complete